MIEAVLKVDSLGNDYISNCPFAKCSLNQNGACVSTNTILCNEVPYYFMDDSFDWNSIKDAL